MSHVTWLAEAIVLFTEPHHGFHKSDLVDALEHLEASSASVGPVAVSKSIRSRLSSVAPALPPAPGATRTPALSVSPSVDPGVTPESASDRHGHGHAGTEVVAKGPWNIADAELDRKFWKAAVRYVKLCAAFSSCGDRTVEFSDATDIHHSDILDWRSACEPTRPAYCLVYDERRNSILLIVRAERSLREFVRLGREEPAGGMHAHSRIGAAWLLSVISSTVDVALSRCHDATLVVIGHGLAAGIASAVAAMSSQGAQCWAFSPPPTAIEETAQETRSCVVSFVCCEDIVPHLSYTSMLDVYSRAREAQARATGDSPLPSLHPRASENQWCVPGRIVRVFRMSQSSWDFEELTAEQLAGTVPRISPATLEDSSLAAYNVALRGARKAAERPEARAHGLHGLGNIAWHVEHLGTHEHPQPQLHGHHERRLTQTGVERRGSVAVLVQKMKSAVERRLSVVHQ
eukprot:m51a1_g11831 hypothetical protein (460) ;mRNA; r:439756-441197